MAIQNQSLINIQTHLKVTTNKDCLVCNVGSHKSTLQTVVIAVKKILIIINTQNMRSLTQHNVKNRSASPWLLVAGVKTVGGAPL